MREHEAHGALEQAQALERRVRRQGVWLAGYCTLYSAASFVMVLVLGLLPQTPTAVVMIAFFVLIGALIVWGVTRPVTPRHFAWLHTAMIVGWGVCYLVALLVGGEYFPENPAWWVPAAAATALPGLIVALLVLRRSRRST